MHDFGGEATAYSRSKCNYYEQIITWPIQEYLCKVDFCHFSLKAKTMLLLSGRHGSTYAALVLSTAQCTNGKCRYKLVCWDNCVWLIHKLALTNKGLVKVLWGFFFFVELGRESRFTSRLQSLCSVKHFIQLFAGVVRQQACQKGGGKGNVQQLSKGSSAFTHLQAGAWKCPTEFYYCANVGVLSTFQD